MCTDVRSSSAVCMHHPRLTPPPPTPPLPTPPRTTTHATDSAYYGAAGAPAASGAYSAGPYRTYLTAQRSVQQQAHHLKSQHRRNVFSCYRMCSLTYLTAQRSVQQQAHHLKSQQVSTEWTLESRVCCLESWFEKNSILRKKFYTKRKQILY